MEKSFYLLLIAVTCCCLLASLPPPAYAEEDPTPQDQSHANLPIVPLQPILTVNAVSTAGGGSGGANEPQPPAAVPPSITSNMTITPEQKELQEIRETCFYAEAELCSLLSNDNNPNTAAVDGHRDINSCQCHPHPTSPNSWYCCNITHLSMISSCSHINITIWKNLHIRNVTLPTLDLSSAIFQNLDSVAITDGNITSAIRSFSRITAQKCLNISNNDLSDISLRIWPSLKILDISNNNLTHLPKFNPYQNITVDVSGNNFMICDPIIESIYRSSLKFLKPETSFCLLNRTFHWFNATDRISIKEVAKPNMDCPHIPGFGKCVCKNWHMIMVADQADQKIIGDVDCSNLGLLELPPILPENTFSLNISNNKIKSLGNFFHTSPYENLACLFADNNQISSILELEGTPFMERFQRLDLRNNALSSVPEYLLNNVLNDHNVGRNIFLGGNKLQCDCNSAKVFKYWLLEHMRDIPDYNEILCRNMPQRVMELREMKLCQSPHDWTDYIYYLIATEVILLLALITKVSYDYWVFKTAGYLPWPASKMPKLPCDWLCES